MPSISATDPLASLLSSLGGSPSSAGSSTSAPATSTTDGSGNGLISAPGIGSGLDVNTLVTKLVQADIQPAQNQIDNQRSNLTTQTSALGQLKSLLASLQGSLATLADGSAFSAYSATSSDKEVFTATAGPNAVPGSYQIEVQQLAAAQKLTSGAFASGAAVGTGTLTLTIGSESVAVNIDAGNNTLTGIRDAINGATGNPGVSATIVHATDGDHLVLTSNKTGLANAFSVNASGGDGGLDALTWDAASATGNLTQQAAAADAEIVVDGLAVSAPTNVVAGAVDGITLDVASAYPGQSETLTVGRDTASIEKTIKGFVNAYNKFVHGVSQLASYDPDTKTAGPLLGDATLTSVRSQLAMVLSGSAGGASTGVRTLGDIGVDLQADGTLKLDSATLDNTLGTDPNKVAALFGSTTGYATNLGHLLNGYLGAGGLLDVRNNSLQTQSERLDQRQTQLNQRQAAIQKRYLAQFTALDVTMSKLTQTSSFLTSQLDMLANMYKPDNK